MNEVNFIHVKIVSCVRIPAQDLEVEWVEVKIYLSGYLSAGASKPRLTRVNDWSDGMEATEPFKFTRSR